MGGELLREIKFNIREDLDSPTFTDEEIVHFYNQSNQDINETCYKLLIMKSEASKMSMSGMSMEDDSKFWLRLASLYKKNESRVL